MLDARAFAAELRRMLGSLREVAVAELLITAIDVERDRGLARIDVRYDIVGRAKDAGRVEHVGVWRMKWRRDGHGVARPRVDRGLAPAEPSPGARLHRGHRGRARAATTPSAASS